VKKEKKRALHHSHCGESENWEANGTNQTTGSGDHCLLKKREGKKGGRKPGQVRKKEAYGFIGSRVNEE